MKLTSREKRLIKLLKQQKMSVSHQFDHLMRVAEYGVELGRIYKAKRGILVPAALLHDLGRSDTRYRGRNSAKKGAGMARPVLKKAGYSTKEIELICRVIAEHDDPKFHSDLSESQVFKDADYLDGFGARGIMRSIMYAGETGGGVEEAVKRLGKAGRDRLKGLSFLKSQRLGWQRHRLTELFLAELERGVDALTVTYPGRLVVVEGISGSGKDTQTKMLAEHLRRRGKKVLRVNHPTEFLKKLWRQWRKEVDDRLSEAFLMMADRVRMVRTKIMPALKQGKIVVSSRSSISVQVYQYEAETLAEFYRYCFGFEPLADLVIYLDIPAKEALKRADVRVEKGKEQDRGFFGKRQIEQRRLYEKALKNYPKVVKVNASGSRQEIHQQIVACVDKIL